MAPTREGTPRPEPGIRGCASCVCVEPSASQSQWAETSTKGGIYLYNLTVGFVVGVCTCATLHCIQRGVSREILVAEQLRSQVNATRFQAHSSTVENLKMELRNRAVSPWSLPLARTPLEIKASLLDSDVQDFLGTGRSWLGTSQQVVGYSHRVSDYREVARAQLLRDSVDSCWRRGRICSSCKSSCRSGFGDAGRRGRRSPRRWIVRSVHILGALAR